MLEDIFQWVWLSFVQVLGAQPGTLWDPEGREPCDLSQNH